MSISKDDEDQERAALSNKLTPYPNVNLEVMEENSDPDMLDRYLEKFPEALYLVYREQRVTIYNTLKARDRFRRWHKATLCPAYDRTSVLVAARTMGMYWADWVFEFGYPCNIGFQKVLKFDDALFRDPQICAEILTGFKDRMDERHDLRQGPEPILAEVESRRLKSERMGDLMRQEFVNYMESQRTPPCIPLPKKQRRKIGKLARRNLEVDAGR